MPAMSNYGWCRKDNGSRRTLHKRYLQHLKSNAETRQLAEPFESLVGVLAGELSNVASNDDFSSFTEALENWTLHKRVSFSLIVVYKATTNSSNKCIYPYISSATSHKHYLMLISTTILCYFVQSFHPLIHARHNFCLYYCFFLLAAIILKISVVVMQLVSA